MRSSTPRRRATRRSTRTPGLAHGPRELDELDELEGTAEELTPLPESIGPYRVLSEIGRGGMGRVYLAVQEGEGFTRRLAVKVVAPEGSGPEIERRFREERRILAALEHPGIARFHDAGRDRDGRWYLALEYIDGVGLLEHAKARELPTEGRLRLFLAVLEAVAFAHAHGVVHRDLKPANILVGADGRPRLLDFGIAKFIDSEDAAAATQTRTALRALTPAYASPEQFRGESVTPASDVFSLGVLLYELLAGVRPFGGDGVSQVALERAILEADPDPPSTASRRAGIQPGVSPGAGSAQASTSRRLSRDLDAICLKALRKHPGERYPSATELAADLERHLAGLPVAARGEDRRYRAARFLARHRAAIAVVSALAVAVVAVGLAIGGARRDELGVGAEPAPQPFRFSGLSGKDVPALEAAFVATPGDVEAGARLALALEMAGRGDEALLVVARLRQIPDHGTDPLIDYVEASVAATAKQSQRALVLFGTALDRASASGRGDLVPQIRASRGRLLFTLGRREEALRDMESARASFERANDPASLARVLNDLAIDPLSNGRLAEGERLLEQALAASRGAGAGGAGVISMNLAMVLLQRGFPIVPSPGCESRSRPFAGPGAVGSYSLRSISRRRSAISGGAKRRRPHWPRRSPRSPRLDGEDSLAYALRLRGDDRAPVRPARAGRGDRGRARGVGQEPRRPSAARLVESPARRARRRPRRPRRGAASLRRRAASAARKCRQRGNRGARRRLGGECDSLRRARPRRARSRAASARIRRRRSRRPGNSWRRRFSRASTPRKDAAMPPSAASKLLAAKAAGSTSVRRRLALLRASAALATATGSAEAARRDLAAACDLARSAGRLVEALELELEMADVDFAHGRAADGAASVEAVARQAKQLGLVQLSARARLLSVPTRPREAGGSAP